MAKLPNSFRERNRTTRGFRERFAQFPAQIQRAVRVACVLFNNDPRHPSLRYHELDDNRKGQHLPGSFSVSITMQYRAIHIVRDQINVWYWIGTHGEYDRFTGKK
jgi:hypothetical protein